MAKPQDKVADLKAWQDKLKGLPSAAPVKDMLHNSPMPDLIVPTPYTLTEKQIFKSVVKNKGKETEETIQIEIAQAPVLITGIARDIESGDELWEVIWLRKKRWQRLTVDRDICQNTRKIVDLAKQGFPANSINAKELIEYLAQFEALNLDKLPVSQTSSHLGWQRDMGFLYGHIWIPSGLDSNVSFRGADAGDEQIADAYHTSGTIEDWLTVLTPVMEYERARVAWYTAYVSSVLHIFQCGNFGIDYAGRTSIGKSTVLRIGGSVVGCPNEKAPASVMNSWDNTRVFLERASSVASGFPTILDDSKLAKNPKAVADALYAITNGRGRGRGNIRGLARTGTWRTVLLSSGEQPAISFTNDGGTRGRILEIRGNPFGASGRETGRLVEQLNLGLMENYGHGMPLFVKWVMNHKSDWADWAKTYRSIIPDYANQTEDSVGGRLSAYAAVIEVGASLVHAAFAEAGFPLPWVYAAPISKSLWSDIVSEAADPIGEETALREVVTWATNNQQAFFGRHLTGYDDTPKQPPGGFLGRWDKGDSWTYIAFDQARLREFLEKQNYNSVEILNGWKERGWLDIPVYQKGYQKKVSVNGEKVWYVVVKREAIETC